MGDLFYPRDDIDSIYDLCPTIPIVKPLCLPDLKEDFSLRDVIQGMWDSPTTIQTANSVGSTTLVTITTVSTIIQRGNNNIKINYL